MATAAVRPYGGTALLHGRTAGPLRCAAVRDRVPLCGRTALATAPVPRGAGAPLCATAPLRPRTDRRADRGAPPRARATAEALTRPR
ncbi:hypothetical protein [Streptomyces sp. NPDC101145]|uniref:hypothetical protein n=1 Tax=Streptomyces sp. NPDC101145 TaxID=3366112 RepID=UPI0037FB58CD